MDEGGREEVFGKILARTLRPTVNLDLRIGADDVVSTHD